MMRTFPWPTFSPFTYVPFELEWFLRCMTNESDVRVPEVEERDDVGAALEGIDNAAVLTTDLWIIEDHVAVLPPAQQHLERLEINVRVLEKVENKLGGKEDAEEECKSNEGGRTVRPRVPGNPQRAK